MNARHRDDPLGGVEPLSVSVEGPEPRTSRRRACVAKILLPTSSEVAELERCAGVSRELPDDLRTDPRGCWRRCPRPSQ
jgi:hypothetical protein